MEVGNKAPKFGLVYSESLELGPAAAEQVFINGEQETKNRTEHSFIKFTFFQPLSLNQERHLEESKNRTNSS